MDSYKYLWGAIPIYVSIRTLFLRPNGKGLVEIIQGIVSLPVIVVP